jgi:molecular chaperone HscA
MAKISIDLKEGKIASQFKDIIVGIDLGTTNSLVAYIKDDKAVAVKDESGKNTLLPSVVHFAADGSILTGETAKEKLVTHPRQTIYSVKRLMGKSYKDIAPHEGYFGYQVINDDTESLVKVRVGDRFFSPIELSAEILKSLKIRIEKELDAPVSKAVITVPAYFNDAQRQATRDAGKLAGLEVLRIVNEPTAASLAYGLDKKEEQTIAVYDLGGGTFDISILQIRDGIFEVLSTNGDTFLGGDDFDRAITDFWIEENKLSKTAINNDKALSQQLRLTAEDAKKSLTTSDIFDSAVGGIPCKLTRPQFEALIQPFLQKTLDCCRRALKDAKLSPAQVDAIVMVGGSTRTPVVKKTVTEFFGKPVYDKLNPDEVVALGAAIQANVLAGNQKDVLLIDITPLSLGIETMGGLMDVILPRNTKIPVKAGRQYTTSADGQKNLKIAVYQGERDLVEHNRKLGEFILRNIPPMPAGLPKIEVHFVIDADGILKVKAKELRSGVEQSVEIKAAYGLSEEDMALMLLDSIQHAEADMKTRGLLEARNEANHLLLSAAKFLEQNKGLLSEAEASQTAALSDSLKTAVAGQDKDLINKAIQALNEFTAPLAHKAMDHTILQAMQGKKIG